MARLSGGGWGGGLYPSAASSLFFNTKCRIQSDIFVSFKIACCKKILERKGRALNQALKDPEMRNYLYLYSILTLIRTRAKYAMYNVLYIATNTLIGFSFGWCHSSYSTPPLQDFVAGGAL